jgi:hypothetical protein
MNETCPWIDIDNGDYKYNMRNESNMHTVMGDKSRETCIVVMVIKVVKKLFEKVGKSSVNCKVII